MILLLGLNNAAKQQAAQWKLPNRDIKVISLAKLLLEALRAPLRGPLRRATFFGQELLPFKGAHLLVSFIWRPTNRCGHICHYRDYDR